jgi:hypothetical protein
MCEKNTFREIWPLVGADGYLNPGPIPKNTPIN